MVLALPRQGRRSRASPWSSGSAPAEAIRGGRKALENDGVDDTESQKYNDRLLTLSTVSFVMLATNFVRFPSKSYG